MKKRAPVYRNKSGRISAALIEHILEANLRPGDVLGTEAALIEEFGVSRPTLRESLRMLEAQGIVSLRPGPGGGATIARPGIDGLAHALSVFLYLQNIPFGMVLRAREIVEPALAREAALHAAAEDLDEMERSIARMRAATGQDEFLQENRVFHETIARASRNQVLESFWAAISLLASGEHHGVTYSFGNRLHVIRAHEEILQACRARDPAVAAARMAAHVGELEHLVRRRHRSLLEEPTRMLVNPAAD